MFSPLGKISKGSLIISISNVSTLECINTVVVVVVICMHPSNMICFHHYQLFTPLHLFALVLSLLVLWWYAHMICFHHCKLFTHPSVPHQHYMPATNVNPRQLQLLRM